MKQPLSGQMQQLHSERLMEALSLNAIQNELQPECCDKAVICSTALST